MPKRISSPTRCGCAPHAARGSSSTGRPGSWWTPSDSPTSARRWPPSGWERCTRRRRPAAPFACPTPHETAGCWMSSSRRIPTGSPTRWTSGLLPPAGRSSWTYTPTRSTPSRTSCTRTMPALRSASASTRSTPPSGSSPPRARRSRPSVRSRSTSRSVGPTFRCGTTGRTSVCPRSCSRSGATCIREPMGPPILIGSSCWGLQSRRSWTRARVGAEGRMQTAGSEGSTQPRTGITYSSPETPMASTDQHPDDPHAARRELTDADVRAARDLATAAHLGQFDKAGVAYIEHPQRVVGHLVSPTNEQAAVAWLHDVVEDTPTTLEDVEAAFGPLVAAGVDAMTHRPGEPSLEYYARVKANPLALTVKTADLADNTDPVRLNALPPELRARLEAKYAIARRELGLQ